MLDYEIITGTERQKNILTILNEIVLKGEVSAIKLAKSTHVSVATVSRVLNILKNEDIIVRDSKETTDLGRPPDVISLNSTYGYYLHFFIETNNVYAYLIDFCGNLLDSEQKGITRGIKVQEFVHILHEIALALIESRKIKYDKLIAASIAIPGLVDDKKKIIKRIPNFINFKDVNLFSYACSELKIPVIINNRARLCAIGEYINYKASNLVYIDFTNYNGIGAGIIIDGKLYTGKNGFAGEIGDILVDLSDFDKDHVDDEGNLETQAGIGALYQRLNLLLLNGRAKHLKEIMKKNNAYELDLDLIGMAIRENDYDVIDTFNNVVKKWSIAIINLVAVLNPDLIILGGVIDERHKFLLDRIKHYIQKILYYDIDICLRKEDSDSQILGGIYALKKYVLNNTLKKHLTGLKQK